MGYSYGKPITRLNLLILDDIRKDAGLPLSFSTVSAMWNAYGYGASDVAEQTVDYVLEECEQFADSVRKNGIDAAVEIVKEHLCRKIAAFYDDGDDLITMVKKSS